MAKKQTRRSLSVSRAAYEALIQLAHTRRVPAARIVEAFIRSECGLPEAQLSSERKTALEMRVVRKPTPDEFAEYRAARESRLRVALDAKHSASAEQREREALEAAERNPCRLEKCSREGLHTAHDVPARGVR